MTEKGTRIAIRAKGHILAQARVKHWVSDGDIFSNARPIRFPQAQYDWPTPDEIVCFNDDGTIFSRSKLPPIYVVEEESHLQISTGDYEITLLPPGEEK